MKIAWVSPTGVQTEGLAGIKPAPQSHVEQAEPVPSAPQDEGNSERAAQESDLARVIRLVDEVRKRKSRTYSRRLKYALATYESLVSFEERRLQKGHVFRRKA